MKNLSPIDIDHHLEKLEFALAISQTIGDKNKSAKIRAQLKMIGYNKQEPGT
ncbi:hypothetical protein [Prochlorococcus marinus]|uniref:hypothetical protein n=1 Tax=Prochlorococcus marinus TaxID=1219 RepID=UPI0022B4CE86|nr:hypothetical protein [Prochlorococcus marinus]